MASAQRTRVFIDSSVFIAASISDRGSARDLILAGLAGQVALVVSDLVLVETERNLARKAPGGLPAFNVFKELLPEITSEPSRAQVLAAAEVVHLKDAPILAAAVRARAGYLATYDRKHLLAYQEQIATPFGLTVTTPDQIPAVAT